MEGRLLKTKEGLWIQTGLESVSSSTAHITFTLSELLFIHLSMGIMVASTS